MAGEDEPVRSLRELVRQAEALTERTDQLCDALAERIEKSRESLMRPPRTVERRRTPR